MQVEGIVGIDEVGRGAWAGPVVAAAVILAKPINGLKDSKLLTKKQRESLDKIIRKEALSFGIGWVEPAQIDQIGLSAAISGAMNDALSQIITVYQQIILDGNFNFLPQIKNVTCLPKADQTVPAVSAASIVAKVARDNYMNEISLKFPSYGFAAHVGYGTKTHIDAIKKYGACELHRMSYKPLAAFTL